MIDSCDSGPAHGTAGETAASTDQQIAFENEIVGIGLLKNRHVVRVNRRLAAMFGYEPHEMTGMATRALYASDEAYEAQGTRSDPEIAQHGSFSSDAQFRRKEGSMFWGNCGLTGVDGNDPSKGIIWVVQDVTERKQTEEVLRQSEARLRQAQVMAHIGNWDLDLVTKRLFWSDEIFNIFEIDPRRFGASYEAFLAAVHPEDRMLVDKAYTDSLADKSPYAIEHRLLMPDGRIKFIREQCLTDFDSAGGPLRSVGTVQDITERKQAEEARARLAAIVENSNDAIISRALDGTILTWNKSAERLFGYSAAEAIGSNVDMLIPSDRTAEAQRNLALLHQGRALAPYETVRLTKDGRSVHVSIGAAPIVDAAGNVTRVALIFRDITERKRAEIQLRLAASVFGSAAEGIMITDRDNIIVSVNQAFTEITGYPTGEAIGKNPRLLGSGWQEAAFYQEMWDSIKEAGRWQGEIWDRRKNGEIYCELLSISAVRDDRGEITHHCAIVMDITRRKAAEAAIRRLNADLEDRVALRTAELERINKELEAFSYSVSHDLRAPLRTINGFSNIVLEESKGKLDEDSVKHLQRIRAGGERMERLIDDLLTLSQLSRQAMHSQDIDLTELAHQTIDALAREHPERNAGVIVAPGMRGNGDPGLIRIVLENLIGNAWKFTSRTSEARIEVGIEDRHGTTAYFVRDNGAGFNMKYADKLFSPFKRLHADKEFEGTGIGLSIVERIVTRHGGRVWAEGKEGQGAVFYFTLGPGDTLSTPDTGIEPAPKPM